MSSIQVKILKNKIAKIEEATKEAEKNIAFYIEHVETMKEQIKIQKIILFYYKKMLSGEIRID